MSNVSDVSSNSKYGELRKLATTGGKAPLTGSTIINNENIPDKNSIHNKNFSHKKNYNRRTARRTTHRPADFPPLAAVSLIVALVAIIVVVVAGGNHWVTGALTAVVLALASKFR
jgi:hypothetical protein